MRRLPVFLALSLLLAGCGGESSPEPAPVNNLASAAENVAVPEPEPEPEPLPDTVRVRLETEEGPIVLALDAKRAPITTANFVRYVDEGRFNRTAFYRAVPTKGAPKQGFIQGGISRDYRRMLPAIEHEPTSKTGLTHLAGTISMARTAPGTATGEFFITASAIPSMDAKGEDPGYAAFGRVVEGLDIVRDILAAPTIENAGRGAMRGQMLADPVEIVRAERLDKKAEPSDPHSAAGK
jgi:peptidyl-prolyl cis-trans isomerase A (cyclophilin A)